MFYIIISYGCKCVCEECKKESTIHILTTITEKRNHMTRHSEWENISYLIKKLLDQCSLSIKDNHACIIYIVTVYTNWVHKIQWFMVNK